MAIPVAASSSNCVSIFRFSEITSCSLRCAIWRIHGLGNPGLPGAFWLAESVRVQSGLLSMPPLRASAHSNGRMVPVEREQVTLQWEAGLSRSSKWCKWLKEILQQSLCQLTSEENSTCHYLTVDSHSWKKCHLGPCDDTDSACQELLIGSLCLVQMPIII